MIIETGGPNEELYQVIKSLTREELEAYALMNVIGYNEVGLRLDEGSQFIAFGIPQTSLLPVIELASEVSYRVMKQVTRLVSERN